MRDRRHLGTNSRSTDRTIEQPESQIKVAVRRQSVLLQEPLIREGGPDGCSITRQRAPDWCEHE